MKGSAFACVNEGPGPVLCIPIDHHSEGLEVCCVDGRATTVASRHLTIWSTKCPSGATPSAIANGEDAEVLSFVRDGCLVNDATQTSNACIARCFDLLMSASSCRRMLNGGTVELLVSAIPALLFKPVLITLLDVLCLLFGGASVLPEETRLEVRRRAVQAGLPAHLAELLWMHLPEDVESIAIECASRLLRAPTGRRTDYVRESMCISRSVDAKGNRANAAIPSTLDAVVDAMKRSPHRRSTQHWGMQTIAQACLPSSAVDKTDVLLADAFATRMVHRGVHALVITAMLQHGLTTTSLKHSDFKFDTQGDSRHDLRPPPLPPPLSLLTVGAQCLLSLIILGPGRFDRMKKLREAGALKALTLAATEPERDVYDWSRHGFRQSVQERIVARERASRTSGSLRLLLIELSDAFEELMLHEVRTSDLANFSDIAVDTSFSSAVLELVLGSALPDTAERDVDVLSKQLRDAAALAGYGSDDDNDPDMLSHAINNCLCHKAATSPQQQERMPILA